MKPWPALLLLAPLAAAAQEPAPLALRLERSGDGPVWFGQRVGLIATLRTPIRFASAPLFPELTFQGRAFALPNGTTTPGSERAGAETFVLLQHAYDIFPAGAGTLTVAPVTMAVSVGAEGGGVATAQAASAPLALEMRLPPGTTDPARLVTTPSLRLTATQEGDPARVPVGEAVTRTVTLVAEDSTAMLLPPMPWAAPEGVRAYPDPPRLTDHADRGVLSATRVDRAAFVPERPGRYELPGATLQWFDPRSGRMQALSVPPLAIQAVAAAAAPGEAAPARRPWRVALGVAGGLVLLATLGWWLRRRRQRPTDPEAEGFAALRRACRADDAPAAMAALLRWTALASPSGAPPTAARLATLAGVPALGAEAAALAARCYGAPAASKGWDGAPLLAAAGAARQARRRRVRPASPLRPGGLPALNPVAAPRPVPRVTLPGWAR